MKNFVLNTKALAQSKEGALVLYPEREKGPAYFYITGETKAETVYASVNVEQYVLTMQLYGMDTNPNLRGLNITVKVGGIASQNVKITTNLGISLNAALIRKLWPGGPYSLLIAIVALEEAVTSPEQRWLRSYMFGVVGLVEKRMPWAQLLDSFKVMFS